MTEKRRFRALLAALALTAAYPAPLLGDVTVYGKVQLRTERSGGADCAALHLAARKIEALLRREKISAAGGRTLLIHTGAKRFQLGSGTRIWELHLPGTAKLWKRDFQLRRQLYAALIAARLEERPASDAPEISPWLTAAIDLSIANSQGADLYLANNNTFYRAALLLQRCGKLPDFARLCTVERELCNPLTASLYDEFSLLLAQLLAKRKLLTVQLRSDLGGGAPDAWAKKFSGGAESRQRSLERDAWSILWNQRLPLPPDLAAQRLDELAVFAVPEVDEKGIYSGKTRPCTAVEAARQLAAPNRTDAAALRKNFAGQWNAFALECDPPARALCRKAAAAISLLGVDPDAPKEFTEALDGLKKHLARRRRYGALLDRTEKEKLPIPRLLDAQLEAVKSANPALTTPEKIFLELSEREYLAE